MAELPCQTEELRTGADDADLDSQQAYQQRCNDGELVQQQLHIQAGACGHKEQPQQHTAERPNVRLDLGAHAWALSPNVQ